jgi:hypothetical protein
MHFVKPRSLRMRAQRPSTPAGPVSGFFDEGPFPRFKSEDVEMYRPVTCAQRVSSKSMIRELGIAQISIP